MKNWLVRALSWICLFQVTVLWSLPEAEKRLITELHNSYRSQLALGQLRLQSTRLPPAQNMYKLEYEPRLEKMAQNHANTCAFFHSIEHRRPNLGENICRYVIDQPVVSHETVVEECIKRWWNTSVNFDPTNLKFNLRNYLGNANDFTAMVWGSASAVGCGLRQCDESVFFVCNYGPRSNVLDEPIFEPGLPCQADIECTTFGRSRCENSTGLCVAY